MYLKQTGSVLWRLMLPCAVALAVITLASMIVNRASREAYVWYGSLVQAPGLSLVHGLIYLWAGYRGFQRTRLIKTGMLAAAATSLVGVTVLGTAAAISDPTLILAPFSKPFIVVILSTLLLLALSYGVLLGALGGLIGRLVAPGPRDVRFLLK